MEKIDWNDLLRVLSLLLFGFLFGFIISIYGMNHCNDKQIKSGIVSDSNFKYYKVTPINEDK